MPLAGRPLIVSSPARLRTQLLTFNSGDFKRFQGITAT
jgi:hypothetical protein